MLLRAKIIDSEVRPTLWIVPFMASSRLRDRPPEHATLECGPGYVDAKTAATKAVRILAKDIVGATTAEVGSGVLLTLQVRGREQPLTFELGSDEDADSVRRALGIGHDGYGTVGWRTTADSQVREARVMQLLALLCAAAIAACVIVIVGSDASLEVLQSLLPLAANLLILLWLGARSALKLRRAAPTTHGEAASAMSTVVMSSTFVRLMTPRGWFTLPYEAIQGIEVREDSVPSRGASLDIRVPPPHGTVSVLCAPRTKGGLLAADREVLVRQLHAASARARGLAKQKRSLDDRLGRLRRGSETRRAWLARLDATGQMLSSGVGYRSDSPDVNDLWTLLEDPDAEPELRVAAARMLRHTPDARVRIDEAALTVRDEPTEQRIRVALLEDIDAASQALDALDVCGPRAMRHPG